LLRDATNLFPVGMTLLRDATNLFPKGTVLLHALLFPKNEPSSEQNVYRPLHIEMVCEQNVQELLHDANLTVLSHGIGTILK
jgi:hypothetical protein